MVVVSCYASLMFCLLHLRMSILSCCPSPAKYMSYVYHAILCTQKRLLWHAVFRQFALEGMSSCHELVSVREARLTHAHTGCPHGTNTIGRNATSMQTGKGPNIVQPCISPIQMLHRPALLHLLTSQTERHLRSPP